MTTAETMRKEVEISLIEVTKLFEDLQLPLPQRPAGQNLVEQQEWIEGRKAHAEKIEEQRKGRLAELLHQEKEIIDLMSDARSWMQTTQFTRTIPTQKNLDEFHDYLSALRQERNSRLQQFEPAILEARRIMNTMEKLPKLPIEEDIFSLPPEKWTLTKSNLNSLKDLLEDVCTLMNPTADITSQAL